MLPAKMVGGRGGWRGSRGVGDRRSSYYCIGCMFGDVLILVAKNISIVGTRFLSVHVVQPCAYACRKDDAMIPQSSVVLGRPEGRPSESLLSGWILDCM